MGKFIQIRVKDYIVLHGFDSKNKEIEEKVPQDKWVEKVVAIERIQSVTEKFILTTYADGRFIYWEYEGGLKKICSQLRDADLLV